jgi:hypothetical protein
MTDPLLRRLDELDLVLDCLNTKSPKSLKVVLHGFERFGGVPLPIRNLARDPKRVTGAV